MKKTLSLLILLLSVSFIVQAQLLWKITGKNLKHPSYLFGTHHLIPLSFLDSVPGLYKAFNQSDMVIGEMLMNNIDASAKIQRAALLPEHIKMKDLINDSDFIMVDKELKSVLKFGLKEVSMMNPALILTLYEMEVFKKETGYTDDNQSDSYFQLVATEKGKQVIGLETIEQQIAVLFGDKNYDRQAKLLVETVRDKKSVLVDMNKLNTLYKQGKMNELIELSKKKGSVIDMTDEEYARLIDNRNADWIIKLPEYLKSRSCFIAVGALHLGGKQGLIKLLENEGYKVKPLSLNEL